MPDTQRYGMNPNALYRSPSQEIDYGFESIGGFVKLGSHAVKSGNYAAARSWLKWIESTARDMQKAFDAREASA